MSLWGEIVPNYIAAVGGLAATVLAVVSLVLANRARKSDSRTRSALESTLVALDSVAMIQQSAETAGQTDRRGRPEDEIRPRAIQNGAADDRDTPEGARRRDAYRHALADARRKLGESL